jgi:uncharacterized protein (TIGR02246 family)
VSRTLLAEETFMDRMELAADRSELRVLVEKYAFCADRRDREGFAGVFTADGVLATGQSRRFEGRQAIAGVLDHLDANYPQTMHFVGNHEVEVDGDVARGLVYCHARHVYERDGVKRDTLMVIRYHDSYVRTEIGWQIKERRLDIDWQEDRPLQI